MGVRAPSDDPFVRQELAETVYHVLWELVYEDVRRSVLMKAEEVGALRAPMFEESGDALLAAAGALRSALEAGGMLLVSPSEHISRIQEAQASAYHVLRELVELASG